MPDHINITHPDVREKWLREHIKLQKMEAEIRALTSALMEANSDLASIFWRIERGDLIELHYPNGRIATIETVVWDGDANA